MSKHFFTAVFPALFFFIGIAAFCSDTIHILEKGETLYSLSRRYSVPLTVILERNNIADAGKITAGQKIYIPETYTVQKGDTLYGIARKMGVSVEELRQANGLTGAAVLKIGKLLIIPTVKTARPAPAVPSADTVLPKKEWEDPRTYTKKSVDKNLLWPVPVHDISYLSGKLYGVAIDSAAGAAVRAIASGQLISKGPHRGYGQVVFVQAKNKQVYVYGGLAEITVKTGAYITAGQQLGTLASDPFTGTPRLYFMVYENNKPIDPAKASRGS